MRTIYKRNIIAALLLCCFTTDNASAQLSNYKAYSVFVYNFTKYIQWPDDAIQNDFVIGVFGKSPILEELQKMGVNKKAGDKSIRVVELSEATLTNQVHILFIPEQKSNQIATILSAVKGRPVLLVSDKQGLVEKGASISFFSDHNNLKFQLNSNAIAMQNLKISKTLEVLAVKN